MKWKAGSRHGHAYTEVVTGDGRECLALVRTHTGPPMAGGGATPLDDGAARLALVAAAPEMYEALKEIAAGGFLDPCAIAEEAIAKATAP